MKRFIAAAAAVLMLISAACFAACVKNGDDNTETPVPVTDAPATEAPATVLPAGDMIFVENKLDANINAFYVSPINNEEWGEPLSDSIPIGEKAEISLAPSPLVPGVASDVGVIDENAVNYDFYVVNLSYGDVLTVEGNKDGAKLTVLHADGTSATYDATIYSDNDPEGGKVRCLYIDSVHTYDSIVNENGGSTLVFCSMDYPRVSSAESSDFSALAQALNESAENRRFSMHQLMLDLEEPARAAFEATDGYFSPFFLTDKVYVRRADSRVFSIVYELSIVGEGVSSDHPGYSAANYDSRTGEALSLPDVVTDVSRIPDLLTEKLGKSSPLWIDAGSEDLGLVWSLGSDGLSVIVNGEEPRTVLLSFAEYPDLFVPEYAEAAENYTSYFPVGMSVEFDIGGKIESVRVSGQEDEYSVFNPVTVECGDAENTVEAEIFYLSTMLVHMDGKNFLYLVATEEDEYSSLRVFSLDKGVKLAGEAGMCWFTDSDEEQDSYYTSLVTDPDFFFMSTRTDLLSTVDGVKLYYVGSDGMPTTSQRLYMLTIRYELTLLRDVSAIKVENGREAGAVTLPEGTKLTYCATDDERIAELTCEDGTIVHIYLEYSDDFGRTVDGVSIIDVFDGMFFAG